MKNNKVYITGIGSISALGYDNNEIWNNLIGNKKTISVKSDWENEKIRPTLFGEAKKVEFLEEVNWKEQLIPNQYSKLALLACKNAIEDANLQLSEDSDNEVGLIIETCLGATEAAEDYSRDLYGKGVTGVRPIKFIKTVPNVVLGDVSRHFKLNGPSSLLYSENSINYGYDLIKKGIADVIICGAVDHFTEFRVLSEQENDLLVPSKNQNNLKEYLAKAKDIKKNIIGEGSAFIVLESEKSVNRRKAKTYAELVAYHSNFDHENVNSSYKRSPFILSEAYNLFKENIQEDKKIVFASAYISQSQIFKSEKTILDKLERKNSVYVMRHKVYTGDMRAASNVMGVCLSSQILKKNRFLKNRQSESEIEYAFVSNAHEGGASSHFLLKKSILHPV